MRPCACGCKADLDALGKRRQARCASGACRARASRAKRQPQESAQKAHRGTRGGLQVSYAKAVSVLETVLVGTGREQESAKELADDFMRAALSDAQRARLDEREAGPTHG